MRGVWVLPGGPARRGSAPRSFGFSAGWFLLSTAAPWMGCGLYDYDLGSTGTRSETDAPGGAAGSPATGGGGGTNREELVGWAATADCGERGTTGGALGPTVRPTTVEELDDAVRDPAAAVIEIAGRFELGDVLLQIAGNKTLVGVDGGTLVGSARVRDATNVILRNLRFDGSTSDASRDALELDNSRCVWIDHCEFVDGGDSNLDIVRGSDLVTVSWSKFLYATRTDEHRLGSVCGNSNTDTPGRLNVTFHHNLWGDGVLLNMPSVRHGKVHVFNSYFATPRNDYALSAGYLARLLVENNVFDGVNDPIVFGTDEGTAEVVERGNDFSTATGDAVSRGVAFEPPYPYSLDETDVVASLVRANAGVR